MVHKAFYFNARIDIFLSYFWKIWSSNKHTTINLTREVQLKFQVYIVPSEMLLVRYVYLNAHFPKAIGKIGEIVDNNCLNYLSWVSIPIGSLREVYVHNICSLYVPTWILLEYRRTSISTVFGTSMHTVHNYANCTLFLPIFG